MKKKTINEIKSAIPTIDSTKVEDLAEALDKVLIIKRLFDSEDGKVLITELRETSVTAIKKLLIAYKTNPNLETLMGLCASLDSSISFLAKIQDISMEKELRDSLDEAVREAML
jgi:hypothetical protein